MEGEGKDKATHMSSGGALLFYWFTQKTFRNLPFIRLALSAGFEKPRSELVARLTLNIVT